MDIAIAVLGFVEKDLTFSPKEIALFGINEKIACHWLLTPPCDFTTLSAYGRYENLTRARKLRINWFDGESEEARVIKVLRDIASKSRLILSSGNESCEYLEKVLCTPIRDVAKDRFWPEFIKQLPSSTTCIHHGLQEEEAECALQVARQIKKWMKNKYEFIKQKNYDEIVVIPKHLRVPREPEINFPTSQGVDETDV